MAADQNNASASTSAAGIRVRHESAEVRAIDPLAAGQVLAGRFQIIRCIGRGGMGVVYEAIDQKLNRRIALKCAKSGHGERLTPEVRLATEVSHPNICKIFEIHTAETAAGPIDFFTMEFLDGQTLDVRLSAGKLPEDEARAIGLQLCAGLAEAHRHHIIHGDLKSGNVILTKDPEGALRAVITDFGLARAVGERGSTGGTPGYFAPELYSGGPTTVASDIYALGVILHELASGVRPDERAAMLATTVSLGESPARNTPSERQRRLFPAPRAPLPLHSRWDPVLKRCLHPDPASRYQSVDEISRALGPSPVRRRVIITAAAVALAAVTALITYQRAVAPSERVELSVVPFKAAPNVAASAEQLYQGANQQLSRLTNSERIAFSVVRGAGGTHSLAGSLEDVKGALVVRVELRHLTSDTPLVEWTGEYAPEQLRYAPVALAGVVSSALHLPALEDFATVNAAAEPIYREAVAWTREGVKIDAAIASMRRAIELDPDSALTYAGLAEAQRRKYFVSDDKAWLEQARQSLRQAEIRNLDCPEVHSIAGLLSIDMERRELALIRLTRATEFRSANSDPYRRLGGLHRINGQLPEALQAYRKAVEIEPNYFRSHQELSSLYTDRASYSEAAKELEIAVRLAPHVPQLHTALAETYKFQGRFQEAEAALRHGLQLRAEARALTELGQVLMYTRREPEAIPYLRQAAVENANSHLPWVYLGICYRRMGRQGEAQDAFRRGLRIAQDGVVLRPRSGTDRSYLGYLCAQTGDSARAESEVEQALQLSPSRVEALNMTALTYEALGKREKAVSVLASAPPAVLENLQRWPDASKLAADQRFKDLLAPVKRTGP